MERFGYKLVEEEQKHQHKSNIRERRLWVIENEPQISRLQAKTCKILSDHQDVLEYDAIEYPPGTPKISTFLV